MSDDLRMPTGNDDPLRALGKQLPYDRPDASRRDSVRSSLLVAASEGRQPAVARRWILVGGGFVAGALAAAAVAIVLLRGDATTSPSAREGFATIESSSAAELERSTVTTATGTDELVRVRSGKLRLAVPIVRSGDHVRLQTGDAEVEGSGAYEVVVTADALASVTVATGTATIKVKGQQQAVFLAAGETWRAPVITADLDIAPAKPDVATNDPSAPTSTPTAPTQSTAPVAPAVTAAMPPTNSTAPTRPTSAAPTTKSTAPTRPIVATPPTQSTAPIAPAVTAVAPPPSTPPTVVAAPRPSITAVADPAPLATTGSSPTERHFRAGYALLRANKHADAATELGKAADGDGPLAADARYFQAVALSKAGRGRDAERALVAFLNRAPTSVRRGRASVMLARLLVERGDTKSARAWFESALADTDPSVATAARAGIESLK